MPRAVQAAYDDAVYTDTVRGGPLRLLSERTLECRTLWQQLEGYSKEKQPLAVLAASQPPRYVELNEHLQDHCGVASGNWRRTTGSCSAESA